MRLPIPEKYKSKTPLVNNFQKLLWLRPILLGLGCLMTTLISHAQTNPLFSDRQLIINWNPAHDHSDRAKLDALNKQYEVNRMELVGNKKKSDTYLLTFSRTQPINFLVEAYMKTGLFTYVEPNYIGTGAGRQSLEVTPSDELFSRQWGLNNDGTFSLAPATAGADIDMTLAWDIEQGSSDIIVAILDSGVKLDHPEFAGRLYQNTAETIDGQDSDTNGYIDDLVGWDFVNNDADPVDDHGHGTNVAGIIGAQGNNDLGYAGVDWNCQLMVCKILDDENFGYYSWWADAIYYAVDNGAKVINLSVGGSNASTLLQSAVDYAYNHGVTIIVSMMNNNNDVVYYPAGYNHTIAVGATDPNDQRSNPFFWSTTSGSCYGSHIEVVAPGNYIYGLNDQSNSNYNSYWGGTSQAAPIVTGITSLLLAQNPNRTPDDIKHILTNTAEDQVGDLSEDMPGFDVYYGYGRVNAYQALMYQVTSDESVEPKADLVFSPNPVNDYLLIAGMKAGYRYSLMNSIGQVILMHDTKGQETIAIDLSALPDGFYFLQVDGPDIGHVIHKMVKH